MNPNKLLGQNFLICKNFVADIVKSAELLPTDFVLEIGPGKGILTEALVEAVPKGKVLAIEKDPRMVEFLKEKFNGVKNLEIIEGDILELAEKIKLPKGYKIVANIPYYITSHLLRVFLERTAQPEVMVLMVQKEVAERILARDKKESILSISVKVYGEPKIIKKVPATCFFPKPNVDSAILKISKINKTFFKKIKEEAFFEIVKRGFSQKRKLLKNNLDLPSAVMLVKCGIAEKARAENLSVENWGCLAKEINF